MMAFDTAMLEDRGNVLAIGHRTLPGLSWYAADETAGGWCRGLADRLAGQQFFQGQGQVPAADLRPAIADTVLVIDPAPVANHAVAVEHEDLGRP